MKKIGGWYCAVCAESIGEKHYFETLRELLEACPALENDLEHIRYEISLEKNESEVKKNKKRFRDKEDICGCDLC